MAYQTFGKRLDHPMLNDESSAWRDGKFLVLSRRFPVAPDRCIFTNDVVFERSKISRRLSWGSEGPGKWLPTKIKMLWALADMKFVTVIFGFSAKAMAARLGMLVLSAACVTVGAILFIQGLKKGGVPPPMGYLGGGAALVAVGITLFANAYLVLDIVAMDEEYVWLRGAKKRFLESLPPLPPRKEP